MKRVRLACVAVVFLFGISSVSFASGMGDDMKDHSGMMKEEGMKKADESMEDMKGKGKDLSPGVKDKDMSDKIEAQGKEKMGKMKKKPMKEESSQE